MDWKIIHRDSNIDMQPRYMEGAGQIFNCTATCHWTDDDDQEEEESSTHFVLSQKNYYPGQSVYHH